MSLQAKYDRLVEKMATVDISSDEEAQGLSQDIYSDMYERQYCLPQALYDEMYEKYGKSQDQADLVKHINSIEDEEPKPMTKEEAEFRYLAGEDPHNKPLTFQQLELAGAKMAMEEQKKVIELQKEQLDQMKSMVVMQQQQIQQLMQMQMTPRESLLLQAGGGVKTDWNIPVQQCKDDWNIVI